MRHTLAVEWCQEQCTVEVPKSPSNDFTLLSKPGMIGPEQRIICTAATMLDSCTGNIRGAGLVGTKTRQMGLATASESLPVEEPPCLAPLEQQLLLLPLLAVVLAAKEQVLVDYLSTNHSWKQVLVDTRFTC